MKKILFIVTATLFITLTTKGQNLFLISEKSYPCTKTLALQPNSDEYFINELNIVFGKDGTKALLGVKTKTNDVVFRGKLLIYLDDGAVITLNESENSDYVDRIASSAYYLTNEELNKLKTSNINTIRYTLEHKNGGASVFGGNYSASNKGKPKVDFPAIVAEFYMNFNSTYDYHGESSTDQVSWSSDRGISYDLGGRSILSLPAPNYDSQRTGIVVVGITVDRNGRVTDAVPGLKGSTTLDEYLLRLSREAAYQVRFEPNSDAPIVQKGTIIYNFILK